jgi:hypothetical protein
MCARSCFFACGLLRSISFFALGKWNARGGKLCREPGRNRPARVSEYCFRGGPSGLQWSLLLDTVVMWLQINSAVDCTQRSQSETASHTGGRDFTPRLHVCL